MRRLSAILGAVLVMIALPAWAGVRDHHQYRAGSITIINPWTRAVTPDTINGQVFLTLVNDGKVIDALVSASSPIAERIDIYEQSKVDGKWRVRELKDVDVAAGQTVELKPGGIHLRLYGLKQVPERGIYLPLTLVFRKAGAIEAQMDVKPADAMSYTE